MLRDTEPAASRIPRQLCESFGSLGDTSAVFGTTDATMWVCRVRGGTKRGQVRVLYRAKDASTCLRMPRRT